MNPIRLLPLAALALLPLTPAAELLSARAPGQPLVLLPDRDLASMVPESSLAYVELDHLDEVLGAGLEHPLARAILSSPLGAGLEGAWGKSPAAALAELDELAGYELLPALASVGANGAALAAGIDRGRPAWVLILRGNDAEVFERALERSLALAAEQAGFPGAFDAPTSHRRGADHWTIGEDLYVARLGAFGVASNREEWLERTLERATRDQDGLFAKPEFARAHALRAQDELAWGWIDLERARALQRLGGEKKNLIEFAESAGDPGVQFLLGPGLATLGGARSMCAGVALEGEDIALRVNGLDLADGPASHLRPSTSDAPAMALPRGEDNLLEALVYRDLAGVFAGRVDLFAPEDQPKFAEAESTLALFFGGADITETILPAMGPWIAAISRPVEFDAAARPDVPLPGLALLTRVEAEGDVGGELVAAFQTAVGLINVDRAQKSEASLRLGLESVEGVTLTTASFRAPREGEGVDMRYNLAPACALVGDTFVVGTHTGLVAELVRELLHGGESHASGAGETLTLSGAALANVLADNRELLVMNGVLEDGKTRAESESEHDVLHAIASLVEHLRIRVEYPDPKSVRLRATFDVLPAGAAR